MPESYIIYRTVFENDLGYTAIWKDEFYNLLDGSERLEAKKIIESNDFNYVEEITTNKKIVHFLRHYKISRGNLVNDSEYKNIKQKYDKLIKEDRFINLTLTYDFE